MKAVICIDSDAQEWYFDIEEILCKINKRMVADFMAFL